MNSTQKPQSLVYPYFSRSLHNTQIYEVSANGSDALPVLALGVFCGYSRFGLPGGVRESCQLFGFIFSAVAISLSGVMAPGPITAATLTAGSHRRNAGAVIALGHIAIELPLILALAAGLGGLLESIPVRSAIGLTGGIVLVWMGGQLLWNLRGAPPDAQTSVDRHPFLTGVVLTAANPYFLVWWATVGLTLTLEALHIGLLALLLFALVHWLCDLGWLTVLSWAGFKGAEIYGPRMQTAVSTICGLVLCGFGVKFAINAATQLSQLV
jgi:threonine/homoserine/homoserine lactone efflux protein